MAQLGVRRKISFSSSQKKSLNVAADVVENIKKLQDTGEAKRKGWRKSRRKVSFVLRKRSNIVGQEKCWSNEP